MKKAKRKSRLRATEERWLFKIMTNNGLARIESSGSIFADLGRCLRVLQLNITRLSRSETDTLYALVGSISLATMVVRDAYPNERHWRRFLCSFLGHRPIQLEGERRSHNDPPRWAFRCGDCWKKYWWP